MLCLGLKDKAGGASDPARSTAQRATPQCPGLDTSLPAASLEHHTQNRNFLLASSYVRILVALA